MISSGLKDHRDLADDGNKLSCMVRGLTCAVIAALAPGGGKARPSMRTPIAVTFDTNIQHNRRSEDRPAPGEVVAARQGPLGVKEEADRLVVRPALHPQGPHPRRHSRSGLRRGEPQEHRPRRLAADGRHERGRRPFRRRGGRSSLRRSRPASGSCMALVSAMARCQRSTRPTGLLIRATRLASGRTA